MGSAPDGLKQISLAARPVRSTIRIWVQCSINPRQSCILDSALRIPDSAETEFRIPCQWNFDSEFQLLAGCWIPQAKHPRIPASISKILPDSGIRIILRLETIHTALSFVKQN